MRVHGRVKGYSGSQDLATKKKKLNTGLDRTPHAQVKPPANSCNICRLTHLLAVLASKERSENEGPQL